MTDEQILTMVKANLEIGNTLRDTYLAQLIAVSRVEIEREGITLNDSIDDANLIVMYASYLYRKRANDEGETQYMTAAFGASGMPRMLRYSLNNRLLSEKMGGD